MHVEITNNGFTIHDLTADQLELLEEGLIVLQNTLPREKEFNNQRHNCADMFLTIDVELVNSKQPCLQQS